MIRLNLTLLTFRRERGTKWYDWCKWWKISENKNIEIQFTKWEARELLHFYLDTHWYGHDHAGFEIDVTVLGFYFAFKLYDKRHWNYEESRWMTNEEAEAVHELVESFKKLRAENGLDDAE